PASGAERGRLDHPAPVHALAFSSDGRYLATGAADQRVRIWDTTTREPVKELRGHSACVNAVAFAPEAYLLATADQAHELHFWNAESGENVTVHREPVVPPDMAPRQDEKQAAPPAERLGSRLCFSPDGRRLVFAAAARPVQLWDVASRRPIVALAE